jgi:adenine-specific DNA-methyltransferase
VPESLFAEIASNDKQWVQWKNLGVWKGDTPKSIDELKSSLYRMVDTSLFPASFKSKILAEISDIEQFVDGLLVHGDNFHGIRLLGSRYGEAVDCIYIDPPYNTGPTEIIYKNYYKNSSWLSLMQDRLRPSRSLLRREACYAIAIDDFEMPRLCEAVDEVFAGYDRQMVVVNHHPQGGMSNNISRTHEYMLMLVPEGKDILRGRKKSGEIEYRSFQLSGPGRNKSRIGRPNSFYAVLIDDSKNRIAGLEPPPELGAAYPTGRTTEGYERRYPMSPEGEEKVWCRSYESALEGLDRGEIVLSENGALKLAVDTTDKRFSLMSNWTDSRYNAGPHGTALVANMIGDREAFSYPKSIHTVRDAVESMTWHSSNPVVLDFFAGSGTTGHAVINLNREDDGKRKYILMEMGQYFEAVTKPRIIKCVASTDWNAGVMQGNPSVHSHCIKVIKIEGYEDALNNLEMRRPTGQEDLFTKLPQEAKEDYLLNYMLDVESRGSVLSVQHFNKPFDYTLNIAVDSAGAFEPCKIDLVETFNYLVGLRVKQIDAQIERGFVTVTGALPSGETCLVLWRDCEKLDYEGITKLCDRLAINPADNEYDVVYINGDHNIPTVLTQTAEEGGATRVLKLRQIEPEFLERMFSTEDV